MLIEVEGALLGLKSSRIFRHCNFLLAPRRANLFLSTPQRGACLGVQCGNKTSIKIDLLIYGAQMLWRFTEK
jgi:hypothetical protein